MFFRGQKKIGILRGGYGDTHESSINTGGRILSILVENFSDKYKPVDLFIDRDGIWHAGGVAIDLPHLMHKVDLVWNTIGPEFSEILKSFSIPEIGVSHFSHSVLQNREILKKHIQNFGVDIPRHIVLSKYQEDMDGNKDRYIIRKAKEVFEKFGSPWIVRSLNDVGSAGVHVAKTFNQLVGAIDDIYERGNGVLVEEMILGKNLQSHAVSGFRGEDLYFLPILDGSKEDKIKIEELTRNLFDHLGASFYLNLHFTLHPKLGIYLTGVDFHPQIDKESHLHNSLESVGAKMHHLVEHIIERVK